MRWILIVTLMACTEHGLRPEVVPMEHLTWKLDPSTQLDILFVVDNSPAMATHEANWRANQRTMMQVLETIEGGLPDVHVGVITTDVGTLGRDGVIGPDAAGCHERGDRGNLKISGAPVQGVFVSNLRLSNGTRQTNYTGELADVFATMATVGAQGCPYVQPLEAMKRALNQNTANAGFVRTDAYLQVVFVTPNDDCSFARGGFAIESGAINAHECFTRDSELVDVDDYETFLRSLKQDPSKIMVSLIAGAVQPVDVVDGPEGLQVAPSCSNGEASALPPLRLKTLIDRFPNRSSFTSICQQNLFDALGAFAPLPTRRLANQCFAADPVDIAPEVEGIQAECTVVFRDRDAREEVVSACGPEQNRPCWQVVEDPQRCSSRQHLMLEVLPAIEPIPEKTVVADCVVERSVDLEDLERAGR